ncbi:MAG: hypothetical protein H6598_02080 [Flavobacteriales bacterium]|nr:hypothetical protein [Flavobacteriales bacterium]
MRKFYLAFAILATLNACGDSSSEPETANQQTNEEQATDTIAMLDSTNITDEYEQLASTIGGQLGGTDYVNQFTIEQSGEAIFYSSDEVVYMIESASNQEIELFAPELNGEKIKVIETYLCTDSDDEYGCCDEWSGEEFCFYYSLVEISGNKGYISGEYIYMLPEDNYNGKELADESNNVKYKFQNAKNIRSCTSEVLLISKDNSSPEMIILSDPAYNSEVLEFYGEWVVFDNCFMRNGKPVVQITYGVDGNYTFSFYEISKKDGQYTANNYFETSIMVNYDEFASGYDFDADLHQQYKEELGEDFPSN